MIKACKIHSRDKILLAKGNPNLCNAVTIFPHLKPQNTNTSTHVVDVPLKGAKIWPSNVIHYTVEPVYNGHPRDLRNWPLNTGGRLIQDH